MGIYDSYKRPGAFTSLGLSFSHLYREGVSNAFLAVILGFMHSTVQGQVKRCIFLMKGQE